MNSDVLKVNWPVVCSKYPVQVKDLEFESRHHLRAFLSLMPFYKYCKSSSCVLVYITPKNSEIIGLLNIYSKAVHGHPNSSHDSAPSLRRDGIILRQNGSCIWQSFDGPSKLATFELKSELLHLFRIEFNTASQKLTLRMEMFHGMTVISTSGLTGDTTPAASPTGSFVRFADGFQ